MGMAASQLMLLQLTSRKNRIGSELTKLSNQKVSLTRDMQRISKDYQEAINKKVYKWSNNYGVSYIDLSYSNLMKPSEMNHNKPYILSDSSDKIVVDQQYQKYAKMISETGDSGGNWNSVRTQVLSELLGVDITERNDELTTEEKRLINFYDTLFSSIAEKGWTHNSQINDNNYLNQMLQNNYYRITTVKSEQDLDILTGEAIWNNEYSTDIASNCQSIFIVNDDDQKEEALAEYEREKFIINEKETRIDTRMSNLEVEQSSISQMIKSVEEVLGSNIDANMNAMA